MIEEGVARLLVEGKSESTYREQINLLENDISYFALISCESPQVNLTRFIAFANAMEELEGLRSHSENSSVERLHFSVEKMLNGLISDAWVLPSIDSPA